MKDKKQKIILAWTLVAVVSLVVLVLLPAAVQAKNNESIITLPWTNPAKKPVPPSFVLPRQNRWGCLACHSNKSLSKFRGKREVSLYIDSKVLGKSVHEKIACIDCHTNFTYEEHPAKTPQDFRTVAGLACMKCHPYQAELYKKSIHGELALKHEYGKINGKKQRPALCSSCHGFHDVQSPRFEPYKSKYRAAAKDICGKCHMDRYTSYNDWYHGKAYKSKAKDAPTCWDCHNNHRVVKRDQNVSPIIKSNLPRTCGRCHDEPTQNLTSYAPTIHNRRKELGKNPIFKLLSIFIRTGDKVTKPIPGSKNQGTEIVAQPPEKSFLARIVDLFFPGSLRPRREE